MSLIFSYIISKILFISKEDAEKIIKDRLLESFGKELARRVIQNHALSFQWCKKVKEGTDCLRSLMKKYYGKLISKEAFENFIKHLDEYVVVYVAVKQVANYLPKDVLPIFLPVFDENRNYSESIFPEMIDFTNYLTSHRHSPWVSSKP